MAKRKNKAIWSVVGVILAVLGLIWTIPLALKGGLYAYGLVITSIMVVAGIILIAWVLSDEDEQSIY